MSFVELLVLGNVVGWSLAFVQTVRHAEAKYGGQGRSRVCETTSFDPRTDGQNEVVEKL